MLKFKCFSIRRVQFLHGHESDKMSIKQIRNYKFFPNIHEEGIFAGPISDPPVKIHDTKKNVWHKGLEPSVRLFFHHTLSSARRHANFINIKSLICVY